VSDATSSVGGPREAGVVVAAPEDDLFHSELMLRHIGRRRRDVEEVFDASATDSDREEAAAGGVRRRCLVVVVAALSRHAVSGQSVMSSSAATHGILPA